MQWNSFVEKYGHLRPGTYDINSPCYSTKPELFLRPLVAQAIEAPERVIDLEPWEAERISFFAELENLKLPKDPTVIESFLRQSIEGREYAKFIFTRNLSTALELLAEAGETLGFSRQDLSNLPLEKLLDLNDFQGNKNDILNLHKLATIAIATEVRTLPAEVSLP